jgi:hypothetical protein
MGISMSNDFLLGVILGALLVIAGRPLLQSLSKTSKFIPFLLILALLGLGLWWWLRS